MIFKKKKLSVTKYKSSGLFRWKFDEEKIAAAIEELEIKLPVVVRFGYSKKIGGGHFLRRGRHIIWVNRTMFQDWSNNVLWHELFHCVQCERFPTNEEFCAAYHKAGGDINSPGYEDNIFEIEAREFANKKEKEGHMLLKWSW